MIDVDKALEIIKTHKGKFGNEVVPLSQSIGRVLKESWHTDRPLPPYNRVTMDGIAIAHQDFSEANRRFPLEGIAAAGDPQKEKKETGSCYEVMTGAILPLGCDTVIRYEDITITDGIALINLPDIVKYKNVHDKGSDRILDELIVSPNTIISPAEIGVGASLGKHKVEVAKLPKAIVISTGNELVDIEQKPLAHQIRKSNVYQVSTFLNTLGINCDTAHLDDKKEEIKEQMQKYLEQYDVILMSGGVSKGKYDFLPAVLEELGAQKLFHKVAQRPGKPFWFGRRGSCTIFAFPGNPISSFMCMHYYFVEWLGESLGLPLRKTQLAVLTHRVKFKPDLTYFLEVKISYSSTGLVLATPQKGNGSGDLANLAEADAFIRLPRGKDIFEKGEVYPILVYR